MRELIRWVWLVLCRPFTQCPRGDRHAWKPFQTQHRARCARCLIIRDEDGRYFRTWNDYLLGKEVGRG